MICLQLAISLVSLPVPCEFDSNVECSCQHDMFHVELRPHFPQRGQVYLGTASANNNADLFYVSQVFRHGMSTVGCVL